ncbi:MAG TPA: ATP synthase F1 subunit epsilon [Bacteroidales bacterium]|nr:ATP synthase F1 subunit epsilon [Bacteroidales bacterium]
MRLILLTPVKTLFDGEVESVTIPGSKGLFTVLPQHAPLISTIDKGNLSFKPKSGEETSYLVEDGFADVKNDVISVCIEKINTL